MNIINFEDVDVTSEWFCNKLKLSVLVLDLIDQFLSFDFHFILNPSQEFSFVVNPAYLISNLTNGVLLVIRYKENVINPLLSSQLMKRIIKFFTNFVENKSFLG